MKRYISCANATQDVAYDIKARMQNAISDAGLSGDVESVSVTPLTVAYRITITLTAKKHHRKKFTYSAYPKKVDSVIQKAIYELRAWVNEHDYILRDDATVMLLYIQDEPVGYIRSKSSGRGEEWIYTTFDPSYAARYSGDRTGTKPKAVAHYSEIFTDHHDINRIIPVPDVMRDSWYEWRDKQAADGRPYDPNTTRFVLYLPAEGWSVEYIPMTQAKPISPSSSALRSLSL